MQMIWLLGAAAPAKKVHFNLNGSELRGFPIKARSGQSSILYANPLAPKAVARFCLCPAVITGGQRARGSCLSKWAHSGSTRCPVSIPVVRNASFHTHQHLISSHLIISLNAPYLFARKGRVTYENGARIDPTGGALSDSPTCPPCWHVTVSLLQTHECCRLNKQQRQNLKALHTIMGRTNSISGIKCTLNWIWTCKPI